MTWRAHIDDADFMFRSLRVHLIDEWQGGYTLLGEGGATLTTVTEPNTGDRPEPTLTLPVDAAPALMAALARHLGAVEHPEQLRKDYEAERTRVDRFIAHLTEVRP